MKRFLILLLALFSFCAQGFAVPPTFLTDPDGAFLSSSQKTADGSVKSTAGCVYSVLMAFEGVTAGDQVDLRNGGASGTIIATIVAGAANGTLTYEPISCLRFSTDIYYDQTITGGTMTTTIQYS